jgi:hypothetical protein
MELVFGGRQTGSLGISKSPPSTFSLLPGIMPLAIALVVLAGCGDSRAAQVERCVEAYLKGGQVAEGPARVLCMRAAYGNTPQ